MALKYTFFPARKRIKVTRSSWVDLKHMCTGLKNGLFIHVKSVLLTILIVFFGRQQKPDPALKYIKPYNASLREDKKQYSDLY